MKATDVKSILNQAMRYLPDRLQLPLRRASGIFTPTVQEITLRVGRPICIYCEKKRYFLMQNGVAVDRLPTDPVSVTSDEISEVVRRLCDYSVYTRQDEINAGFISAKKGIRVGLCGTAVIKDGQVSNIKNISTLNIRIPREVTGCAEKLLSVTRADEGILLCGEPCSGKTTLLRDMARLLSSTYKVTVVDERNEISASYGSQYCYDIGLADVCVGMNKRQAVMRAIRSLSPEIIICDELGEESDYDALSSAVRCGAAFIATVHAAGMDDLKSRTLTDQLLHSGMFRYVVILESRRSAGTIKRIYDLG